MKAKATIKKPVMNTAEVLNFATGAPQESEPRVGHRRGRKPAQEGVKSKSGQVPEGCVRLGANIREDLHLKLKIVAANRRTTIGELIEDLVEKHL